MEGLGRGHAERPEELLVYYRANVVVAEVTRSIEEKAENKHRRVRRVAKELERLAEAGRELRSHVGPVDAMSGPRAAREAKVFESIAAAMAAMLPVIDSILGSEEATFRSVLADKYDATLASVRESTDWLAVYRDALIEKAKTFGEQFSKDLEEDVDRQNEIANEWSEVDADGLK